MLKQKLASGKVCVGASVSESRDAGVVFAMADGGADYLVVDLEHGAHSYETAATLCAHAHAAGLTPIARIGQISYEAVTRVLDAGFQTLLAANVRTPAEVAQLVELAYYAPTGHRGMALYGGASSNYQFVTDVVGACQWQNDNLLLGLIFETSDAFDLIDEMLQPGIGFAFSGPQDLSQDLGVLGQLTHESVRAAEATLGAGCQAHGVVYGRGVPGLAAFAPALDAGAQILLYSGVINFVRSAMRAASDEVGALGKRT